MVKSECQAYGEGWVAGWEAACKSSFVRQKIEDEVSQKYERQLQQFYTYFRILDQYFNPNSQICSQAMFHNNNWGDLLSQLNVYKGE